MQACGIGHHMRYGAILALVSHHIVQPFAQEIMAVVKVAGGRGEHLCIAGPAQTLVALRTIGRYFDEIRAL